jgi:hypothetical protein
MLRHVAQRYLQHSLPAHSSGRPLINAVHDLRIASYSSSDERALFPQNCLPSSRPLHAQSTVQRMSGAVDLVSWQAPTGSWPPLSIPQSHRKQRQRAGYRNGCGSGYQRLRAACRHQRRPRNSPLTVSRWRSAAGLGCMCVDVPGVMSSDVRP